MISPIGLTSPSSVTLRRYAAQTWGSDGRATRGASTSTTITAVLANAGPRDATPQADGLRTRRAISVLANVELRAGQQQDGTPADEIVVTGVPHVPAGTYVVQSVPDVHPALGPLPASWRAIAVLRPELEAGP